MRYYWPMNDCPVSVGDLLADKYRVERVLGQGGMGVVVAAWHVELEQRVAVKFLLPQFAQDKSASERFRREARAAVKIRSEHVARVIDVGTLEDGGPYMVMEYLEGKDLQTELEQVGCFEIQEAIEFVLQACLAMAEAHAKGMIHRDLKPANLFRTTRPDGASVIKVLDFGISKSIQGSSDPQLSLTRTAAMIGSPLYMSPEQLESARDVDERADVWSLGVILFELLTGSLPFGGETLPQLVRAVLVGQHPQVHELRPEVPPELSAVVSRCIEKDKDVRLANVAELAKALAQFLPDGERYSERVQKVLRLSALSSAATAPIAAVTAPIAAVTAASAGSGVLPSASPAVSAVGDSGQGPATDVDPPNFESRGGTVEVHVGDSDRPASDASQKNETIDSWGGTNSSESKKRSPMVAIAVAAGVCLLGVGAWVAFAGPSAEAQLSDAELEDGTEHAASVEVEGEPVGKPAAQPVEVAPAEPKVEPATAEPEVTPSSEGEADSEKNEHGPTAGNAVSASSNEPTTAPAGTAAAAASSKPTASTKGVPRPAQQRPRPATRPVTKPKPASKKDKDPSDFTDFGGRR